MSSSETNKLGQATQTNETTIITSEPYTFKLKGFCKNYLKGEFKLASIFRGNENTSDYQVGSWDVRSWGYYIVTSATKNKGVVTECQKDICVFPKQMLSLQAHAGRDEKWTVVEGTLTVIINGETREVNAGESVELKAGDIHCMINMTDSPVKVHEIQSGICKETDNMRIKDFGGRATVPYDHPQTEASKKLYGEFMNKMPQSLGKLRYQTTNTVRMWTNRAKFLSMKAA